jgi:GTPase involved in cell partitioning and DNA repair
LLNLLLAGSGAHVGKGLGRMFLRHLRRTAVLLHVVDASAADPATDYLAVREELRLYNPDYVTRPHVVALNKMDLEDAGEEEEEDGDDYEYGFVLLVIWRGFVSAVGDAVICSLGLKGAVMH